MAERIVADSMSKRGGACADCGKHIPRGGYIGKVSEDRPHEPGTKNGPGRWVCWACAQMYEHAK